MYFMCVYLVNTGRRRDDLSELYVLPGIVRKCFDDFFEACPIDDFIFPCLEMFHEFISWNVVSAVSCEIICSCLAVDETDAV